MGWKWTAQGLFRDYYEPFEGYRFFGRNASIDSEEKVRPVGRVAEQVHGAGRGYSPIHAGKIELVSDASGAVVGVVAEAGGKPVRIKANTCVVMATGGYDHNPHMVLENQAVPVYVTNAAMTNTGDGQVMGAKVGAAWGNMDTIWGLPCFYGGSLDYTGELVYDFITNDWGYYRGSAGAIVVNSQGKRFGDESSAYGVFNRAFGQYDTDTLSYTNIPAFFICDNEYVSTMTLPGRAAVGDPLPEYIVQADTLEELAGKLGIDPKGLKAGRGGCLQREAPLRVPTPYSIVARRNATWLSRHGVRLAGTCPIPYLPPSRRRRSTVRCTCPVRAAPMGGWSLTRPPRC